MVSKHFLCLCMYCTFPCFICVCAGCICHLAQQLQWTEAVLSGMAQDTYCTRGSMVSSTMIRHRKRGRKMEEEGGCWLRQTVWCWRPQFWQKCLSEHTRTLQKSRIYVPLYSKNVIFYFSDGNVTIWLHSIFTNPSNSSTYTDYNTPYQGSVHVRVPWICVCIYFSSPHLLFLSLISLFLKLPNIRPIAQINTHTLTRKDALSH